MTTHLTHDTSLLFLIHLEANLCILWAATSTKDDFHTWLSKNFPNYVEPMRVLREFTEAPQENSHAAAVSPRS